MRRLTTLVIACGLVGCSAQGGGLFSKDYLPIAQGSRWEYSVSFMAALIGKNEGKAVSRFNGKETIDGKEYYKGVTVYSGIPGAEAETTYSRKTSEGLFQINGKHKSDGEYLAFPLPLEVGKTWSVDMPFSKMQCSVDAQETAELFETRYPDSYKVTCNGTYEGTTMQTVTHLAPDVGVVKQVQRGAGVVVELNLTGYQH